MGRSMEEGKLKGRRGEEEDKRETGGAKKREI